jgi:hypothetical protein
MSNSDRALGGAPLAVPLDLLQLVESISRKIAFSAMWTTSHRYPLNHEQIGTTAITPRHTPLTRSLIAANLTDHRVPHRHDCTL